MTLVSAGIPCSDAYSALCELMQFANETRHNTKCIKMTGYYPPVPRKYLVILGNDQLLSCSFPSDHFGFAAADLSIFRDGITNGANLVIYDRAVEPLRICLHVEEEDRLYRAKIKLTHLATS